MANKKKSTQKNINQIVVFYSTFPNLKSAESILKILIQEKIISCANIIGAGKSIFMWKDNLTNSKEVFAILKTTQNRKKVFLSRIRDLHPYSIPCLIELKIAQANQDYLSWINEPT